MRRRKTRKQYELLIFIAEWKSFAKQADVKELTWKKVAFLIFSLCNCPHLSLNALSNRRRPDSGPHFKPNFLHSVSRRFFPQRKMLKLKRVADVVMNKRVFGNPSFCISQLCKNKFHKTFLFLTILKRHLLNLCSNLQCELRMLWKEFASVWVSFHCADHVTWHPKSLALFL